MEPHSLYFVGYAVFATVGGIVMAKAQYTRKIREDAPINYKLLKVIFGLALLMWTGAALAAVYYTSSTTSTAVAGGLVGIILSVFFGSQLNMVIKKIQKDDKFIEELATHDALTGLWNRRVFHQTLKREISLSKKLGKPLTLLMLDIDNLSDINLEYGYEPGDLVLRKLADILCQAVRPSDLICRYRSKEIAIIFPNLKVEIACKFAKSFQAEIASHAFDIGNGKTVNVTITAGLVEYSDKVQTEPAFVDAGEVALFDAMELGRNAMLIG